MIRPISKKRQAANKEYLQAKQEVLLRDKTCVCDRWSKVPCKYWDGPDYDHIVSRGRGGSLTDPDNIQLLCRADHNLKTSVLPQIASILGLNGQQALEFEQLTFAFGNPNGIWDEYVEASRKIWDAEKRYMLGGKR